ncbi:HlyC/CorC family transporter [Paracoccus sediminis]|uniref:HlyC/CorC family transporter n=1 Tax=Paracoccus sediminis TaxID=1214787 RepID=A0A238X397_9RHOB|nr:hemolysin family protein [Paracoccus sediminis]TBN49279.1 HlyC/CorC family transporter [Paracoccus sediminis]SNR53048.1 magnesium and cobalt transporter [Paracoccus sediminis]
MNSESRLPAPPLGADAASEADGVGGEGRDLPNARGFLGRFFDALTGGDDEPHDPVERTAQIAPGMVNLRRMRVDDVAVPKAQMVAAPETSSLDDLVNLFREHGFSRLPIYDESLDSPLGMVHLKDLALKHGFGATGEFQLRPMLRPLLYVPPSMSIGVLLQQMQQKRIHMALVIDEYGGVDGLLTIEDLIEQVIGEIEDEHDEAESALWVQERPGQWLIQAHAPLSDVEAVTGLILTNEEYDEDLDTLGGLVFMLAGHIPVVGEVIPHATGAEIEVVEVDPRRIRRVRLRLPAAAAAGPQAAGHDPQPGAAPDRSDR